MRYRWHLGYVAWLLNQSGLRNKIKLMVGGGAVSREYAERLGVDGYHATAQGAVETAWRLSTAAEKTSSSNRLSRVGLRR